MKEKKGKKEKVHLLDWIFSILFSGRVVIFLRIRESAEYPEPSLRSSGIFNSSYYAV